MDLSSLSFAAFILGGIALCYFVMTKRFKQISYEAELVIEISKTFLDNGYPTVGDVVYYFFQMPTARRSALGTTHTQQSGGGLAWAMGDRLHVQKVLGVISALDGVYMHVETFGFEGKGIWHVVDSNGTAAGVGRSNTVMNLAFSNYDQVHFTDAEIGNGNAILRGFRKI